MNRTYQFVLVVYRMEGVESMGNGTTESVAVGALVEVLTPNEKQINTGRILRQV